MADSPARVLVVDDSPTIRRVLGSVLQRAGFEVAVAASGDEALLDCIASMPDLMLVDFTMPGTTGLQFVRKVADDNDVTSPVILMCTRTDDVPPLDAGLRACGVVDTITKPFSPEALLAVVHHTIEKHGRRKRTHEPTRFVASYANIAANESAAASRVAEFADDENTTPAGLGSTLVSSLPESSTGTPGQAIGIALPDDVALIGDLAVIALPEVLQLLKFQSHTGQLLVDAAGLRFDVSLDGGSVVALSATERDGAPTRRAELRLGHYFVVAGLISEASLEVQLATPSRGKPLGERLVQAGLITNDDLRRTVGEQVQDLMVELLRARRGVFALKPGALHLPSLLVQPGWSVDGLMFEALRRIDEWGVIETEVPSFEARFVQHGAYDESGLSADEIAVLAQLKRGPVRVADLVRRSPLRAFDVCRVIYRLAVLKRARRIDDGDQRRLVSDDGVAVPLLSVPRESP